MIHFLEECFISDGRLSQRYTLLLFCDAIWQCLISVPSREFLSHLSKKFVRCLCALIFKRACVYTIVKH